MPAAEAGYAGLLTGIEDNDSENWILLGDPTTTKFYSTGPPQKYYLNGLHYPQINRLAAFGETAIIEVTWPFGWDMDGVQIGRQQDFADRLWKGWYQGDLLYNRILDPVERQAVFEYYAVKFNLWRRNAVGLAIWPFIPNHPRGLEAEVEHYVSEPYAGDPKALTRGSYNHGFSLPFALRHKREVTAAKAFHQQHRPITPFIFRDIGSTPAKDYRVQLTSPFQAQGTEVSHKSNYSFNVAELDSFDDAPPTIVLSGPTGGPVSTITGEAADDIAVETTQLYIDGVPFGDPMAGEDLEFLFESGVLSDGEHSIWAVTTDTSGNLGYSNVLTVEVVDGSITPLPGEEGLMTFLGDPMTFLGDDMTFAP